MHDPDNKDLCEAAKTNTRSSGREKSDMAESDGRGGGSSLDMSMEKLSLVESHELAAKEVEALQLEEEIAELEEKRRLLLARRDRRLRAADDSRSVSAAITDERMNTGAIFDMDEPHYRSTIPALNGVAGGYCSYGRETRRSRSHVRHHHTSSSSSSRSTSHAIHGQ